MSWMIAVGMYNLGFGLFHLAFWRLLKWKQELPRLSATNQAVMQVLNLCLAFFFFLSAYIFLRYPGEAHEAGIGSTFTAGLLLFWVGRFVYQVVFFNLKKRVHQVLLLLFLLGIALHAAALWQ